MSKVTYTPIKREGGKWISAGPSRELEPLKLPASPIFNPAELDRKRAKFYQGVSAFLRVEEIPEGALTAEQMLGLEAIRELGKENIDVAVLLTNVKEPGELFALQSANAITGLKNIVDLGTENPLVAAVINEAFAESFRQKGLYPNEPLKIIDVEIKGKNPPEAHLLIEKTKRPLKFIDLRHRLDK